MIMKNYVTDELTNKVYHLIKVFNEADCIVKTLEEENNYLKETLSSIYEKENSINNELVLGV